MSRLLVSTFLLLSAGSLAAAQDVGTELIEDIELEDYSQTEAESHEDFLGRAVLFEFFAYW